jgi:hypothetical protein
MEQLNNELNKLTKLRNTAKKINDKKAILLINGNIEKLLIKMSKLHWKELRVEKEKFTKELINDIMLSIDPLKVLLIDKENTYENFITQIKRLEHCYLETINNDVKDRKLYRLLTKQDLIILNGKLKGWNISKFDLVNDENLNKKNKRYLYERFKTGMKEKKYYE